MIEILNVLEERDAFQKYRELIDRHTNDHDIKRIIHWIDRYYAETGEHEIWWAAFGTFFFVKNPMIKDAKKAIFESIFTRLENPKSLALKSTLLNTYLQRYHAERISFLAMEVAEGKKGDLADVQLELDGYMNTSGRAAEIGKELVTKNLTELLESTSYGTGLEWRLEALNESLGSIRRGNFLLFGGRPDSGKTTLLCSEATHMAPQLPPNEKVLYFTNEEGGDVVKQRIISSLLGVTHADLLLDKAGHWDTYVRELGGDEDKIMIIDKHDLHINDIEWWLKQVDTGLIIIDQLRKVKGFEESAGVNRLEHLFNLAREWSKEYAPLITVTQLGGLAENVAYPDMSALYESKTAVQGEMDAIINIGRVAGSVPAEARYLNVVKNKLPTPRNSALRNGRWEVTLLQDIARFA